MRPSDEPIYSPEAIQEAVGRVARAISVDYAGKELVVLAVLKGSLFFAADLIRQLDGVDIILEFLWASSYKGTQSQGTVTCMALPETPIQGKHVLVVEDIVDTGRTVTVILEKLAEQQPASLALGTLLDKPSQRVIPVTPKYVGFTVGDQFLVGYGLDYDEQYRELPALHVLEGAG
jgi:hypoxanthine phosphoribosyltransferase